LRGFPENVRGTFLVVWFNSRGFEVTSLGGLMIRPQTCPICGNELAADAALESDFFPFCSKRCRQVDLYRWSEGKYAITEPLSPEHLDGGMSEGEGDDPGTDPYGWEPGTA